jgi:CRP/FNR family transcriptional regulator, cyclic AMP receptor protein
MAALLAHFGEMFQTMITPTWVNAIGYVGALLSITAFSMKTMIPLRVVSICANLCLIVFAYKMVSGPTLFLQVVLLPLNILRLRQMMQLTENIKAAVDGDHSMSWLKPFTSKRTVAVGQVLFRKGDIADRMFFTVSGKYRLIEADMVIRPGEVVGELGMVSPDNKRTLTFECVKAGELLEITYSQIRQLYYQNPQFGFYFLQLTSKRLFDNIAKLEAQNEDRRRARKRR